MGADLSSGPKKTVVPEMNVTPLVDVALVVLIIFMVVTPMAIRQLRVHVPTPSSNPATRSLNEPLTLHLGASGVLDLNGAAVPSSELEAEVGRRIAGAGGTLSLEADDDVPYGDVVKAADRCRRAGADTVSMSTRKPS
jgi:biopolymer transport protein TolR